MIRGKPKIPEENIEKNQEEPPEHSISLRVVVLLMSLLTIAVSCYFSQIDLPILVLFIAIVISGNYFSYVNRERKLKWMKFVSFGGILFVGYLSAQGFLKPLATEFDLVQPFVIFLAGVFSFLGYEMRSRADLNLASGIGLILICVSAPVAKGLLYGGAVLSYITLGVMMLYFDCIERTARAWLNKPIEAAPEVQFANQRPRRRKYGTTISAIAVVPIIALLLFLFMPRPDGLIDQLMSSFKTLNFDYVLDSLMPPKTPKKRNKSDKGQSPKQWFLKNSNVLKDVQKNKEEQLKAEELKKEKDKKDLQSKKKKKKKKVKKKKSTVKLEDIKSKEKIDELKNKNKKTKSLNHTKDTKQEKNKDDKKTKESIDKDSKEKKSRKEKVDKHKDSKKLKDEKKSNKEVKKNKSAAGKSKSKSKSEKSKSKNNKAKNTKNGSKAAGKGAKGKGKSGEGKNGAGSGGEGGTEGGGSKFALTDSSTLDIRKSMAQPNVPVLEVQSRRLVYLRRKCFDRFDGIFWKASKPKAKQKSVKVVDGRVKRAPIKYQVPKKVVPVPTKILPPKGSILSQGGSVAEFKKQGAVNLNVNQEPQPQKVKTKKTDEPKGLDFHAKLSKGRLFEFLSHGSPQFRVSVADALAMPDRFPSIELTQELKVKAKSIGKIVPGGWIPKEVSLKQSELKVGPMGVIRAGKEIKEGTEIKVKTELPIFNLAYMRNVDPISAYEEERVRDNFARYLQLPSTITDDLFELAENNTSPEFNWFVQSEQIADYLRKNYKYSGVDEFSPESKDLVYDFLFKTGSGENIHFSSAFVLLNRCIGIPARLVTGFAPGELNPVSGKRVVRGNDTHSWAEVFIPKMGWVPFDATPDGYLPAQHRETEYTAKDITKKLGLDKEEKKRQLEEALNLAAWIAGALVGLVVLFFIGRKVLSKLIAYIKGRIARGQEWRCYKKVVKAVKSSTSVAREPQETPTEYSSRVRQTVDQAFSEGKKTPSGLPENLEKFLQLYNQVYFGKQKDHLEDLKYYADLVCTNAKQSRGK